MPKVHTSHPIWPPCEKGELCDFLHGRLPHLDARSSAVNLSGILPPFNSRRSLFLTALFGIISSPFSSRLAHYNSRHFSALFRLNSLALARSPSRSSSLLLRLLCLFIPALCRFLSRSASVKLYLENVRSSSAIVS